MKHGFKRYRRESEAVSPVIGTILMVAVTVVLAAVLYVVVGPMINPSEDEPQQLLLLDQGAVTTNTTSPPTYDTFFTVIVVESIQKYPDPDISFVIVGESGSLLTDADFAYDDVNANGFVSEGDSIIIWGMTPEYQGATLKVLYRGDMLGKSSIFVES
jgi:flagellin-like protein